MTSRHELAEAAEALDEVARLVLRQTAAFGKLSSSAVSTLALLRRSGPHRMAELAAHAHVSQPSITAMVSRLEQQGLVCRGPDPSDARSVLVTITRSGKDMLRRCSAARVAFLAGLVDGLSTQQQHSLVQLAPVLRELSDPAAIPGATEAAKRAAAEEGAEQR